MSKYIVKANVSRVENRKMFYNSERRNGESAIRNGAKPQTRVLSHAIHASDVNNTASTSLQASSNSNRSGARLSERPGTVGAVLLI